MSDPIVTVLMAAYNVEQYISQAVESILNQTFGDFEFIIVDDGSDDSTPEILARYDDARIKVIRVENQGLTNALNTGLQVAKGQFVARQDGDDFSSPNRLESQLAEIQKSNDLALVGTWYNVIDEDGAFIMTRTPPTTDRELKSLLQQLNNPFCHGSVLIRRDTLDDVGNYRTAFKNSQDYDLWLRLTENYKVNIIPRTLYSWRLRRGGIGASVRARQRAYGKAALVCAEQRHDGVTETFPAFKPRRRTTSFGLLKQLERESGYEAVKSNLLRQSGQKWKASQSAIRSLAYSPWSLTAWAAAIRSLRSWIIPQL